MNVIKIKIKRKEMTNVIKIEMCSEEGVPYRTQGSSTVKIGGLMLLVMYRASIVLLLE